MFEQLGQAIEGLDIPTDSDALVAVLALRDRLDARISGAVAAHDRAGRWELDGATSMTAWLTDQARLPAPTPPPCPRGTPRHRPTPHPDPRHRRRAGPQPGHPPRRRPRRHLPPLPRPPTLLPRRPPPPHLNLIVDIERYRALASADRDPRPEPAQGLHLSRTLAGRWRLDANLGPKTGELLATALRLTQTPDTDGEPARSAATRRADALGDICHHFLDHQHSCRGGRHRPHLNLIVDIERVQALARAGATTADGTHLDRTTLDRLLCDAALHRVLTSGRSTILDYGTATRTIPAPLHNTLVIRDHHCRFPGCDRPPAWCQGHHVRP